jgi:hypothetical protein
MIFPLSNVFKADRLSKFALLGSTGLFLAACLALICYLLANNLITYLRWDSVTLGLFMLAFFWVMAFVAAGNLFIQPIFVLLGVIALFRSREKKWLTVMAIIVPSIFSLFCFYTFYINFGVPYHCHL